MHIAVKAPYLTFVHPGNEQPLTFADRSFYQPQSLASSSYAVATHDQMRCRYQDFVDAAIEDYRAVYNHYVRQGGTKSFFEYGWLPLLNDVADEAAELLHHPALAFADSEPLWQDLKRIAEGCLLVLDRALI